MKELFNTYLINFSKIGHFLIYFIIPLTIIYMAFEGGCLNRSKDAEADEYVCEGGSKTLPLTVDTLSSSVDTCIWETGDKDFGDCQVNRPTLVGKGKKPSGRIWVKNLLTGAMNDERGQTPSGSDGNWECLLNGPLDCNSIKCASGNYQIKITGDNCKETNPSLKLELE